MLSAHRNGNLLGRLRSSCCHDAQRRSGGFVELVPIRQRTVVVGVVAHGSRTVTLTARVAPGAPPARRAAVERLAGRLKAAVDFGQVDELMSGGVAAFIADITKQCEQIHKALYSSYITYGAETVL